MGYEVGREGRERREGKPTLVRWDLKNMEKIVEKHKRGKTEAIGWESILKHTVDIFR